MERKQEYQVSTVTSIELLTFYNCSHKFISCCPPRLRADKENQAAGAVQMIAVGDPNQRLTDVSRHWRTKRPFNVQLRRTKGVF
jgi:hypothetical protein